MLGQHPPSTTPLQLASQVASTSPACQLPKPDAVKGGLTPKRPRRQVENDGYSAFVRRILRAYARRVGNGDVEALAIMLGLAEEIDTAIAEAVKGLRAFGYSWAGIGSRLGITRQAAQQRWGASACHSVPLAMAADGKPRSPAGSQITTSAMVTAGLHPPYKLVLCTHLSRRGHPRPARASRPRAFLTR